MNPAPGEVVAHYRLIRQIGSGGMGVVWRASDTKLDRDVALKFLPPDDETAANPVRRERFLREAKAASALNHPNIVTIYEVGSSEDGVDFIAMELIEGRSLASVLRYGPTSPALAAGWALQIAEGFSKAHRAGIVHRDVKPANIMVTDEGFIKILDFGLAKLRQPFAGSSAAGADATRTVAESLTRPGAMMGTVGYMPPEQILGESVDSRSDIFAIGAVIYEMITGQKAFSGPTPTETLRAVLAGDPAPPPSNVELGPLWDVALRCLQRDPAARYKDASELAVDIRPLVSGQTNMSFTHTQAVLGQTLLLPPNAVKKRPAWHWTAAVAATLLLVAAGFGGSWLWRTKFSSGSGKEPDSASLPSDPLQRARVLLQRFDRKGNVERAIRDLESALNQEPGNASALAALAEAYVRRQNQNPDPQWLKLGLDAAERALQANPDLAYAHVAHGMVLVQSGKAEQAVASLERALQLDPRSAHAAVWLAKARFLQGRKDEAEKLYRQAIGFGSDEANSRGELGVFYFREARYEDAASSFEDAVRLAPDNSMLLRNLGASYHSLGRYADAASAFQRSLEIESNARTWANLGTARFFQGEYREAVRAMEKAVELAPNNSLYWGNLGDGYRWTPGGAAKAKESYSRAIQLVRDRLAVSPSELSTRAGLALYLMKSGNKSGALAEAATVAASEKITPPEWFKLALLYEIGGDRAQALVALESALRSGYSMHEISKEPDLAALRSDIRYHRLVMNIGQKQLQPK